MKRKILVITAFPPSRNTAGQNYTLNLLNDLKDEYIIDIIYFNYENHIIYDFDDENVRYLFGIKLNKLLKIINCIKIPFLHPFFTNRFSFKILFYLIKNQKNYDYIYFDFSQVIIYSLFINKTKKILMLHDVILQKYFRNSGNSFFKGISFLWIKASEYILLKYSNGIKIVFSKKDKDIIYKAYGITSVVVDFYIDENIKNIEINSIDKYYCFYGAWNRKENLESLMWFMDNVYVHIKDLNIKVIGGGLEKKYKNFLNNQGVETMGFVENPYILLSNSLALIAPLFNGAGVKVKVIEALATGTPVIGTNVTFEGIYFKSDFLFNIDSVDEYIKVFKKLELLSIEDKNKIKEDFNNRYPLNTLRSILKKEIK